MNLRALAAADPDTPSGSATAAPSRSVIGWRSGSRTAPRTTAGWRPAATCGCAPSAPPRSTTAAPPNSAKHSPPGQSKGHAASLVTITVPHDLDDPLSKLVDAERAAWKRVTQGAAWQRLKRTPRYRRAHHRPGVHLGRRERLAPALPRPSDPRPGPGRRRHRRSCTPTSTRGSRPRCRDHGLRLPDQLHAVRIDPNVSAAAAGAYVAKGGDWTPAEEITRGDLKTSRTGSRTPFQILADYYQTGDTRDRDLWREYSRVTRRLAAVRWSRGLRATVSGPVAAPTDRRRAGCRDAGGEFGRHPSAGRLDNDPQVPARSCHSRSRRVRQDEWHQ